jgi:hypothetical protein
MAQPIGAAPGNSSPGVVGSLRGVAARERMSVELDGEVASLLRTYAAQAKVSEGEVVDRAVRAYDLRSLLARVRAGSDLDERQAMALVGSELAAARAQREAAA